MWQYRLILLPTFARSISEYCAIIYEIYEYLPICGNIGYLCFLSLSEASRNIVSLFGKYMSMPLYGLFFLLFLEYLGMCAIIWAMYKFVNIGSFFFSFLFLLCFLPLWGVFWNLIQGVYVSTVARNILEVHAAVESCFTIIKVVDAFFQPFEGEGVPRKADTCHLGQGQALKVNMYHTRQICVVGDLCRQR